MATKNLCTALLSLLAIAGLSACTSSNDNFCTDATDCGVGSECNLESRLCEEIATDGQFAQLLVPTTGLDLLFVVDNSGSMTEEQDLLASDIQHFFGQLDLGDRPDMHIGVISTDMGAGPFGIMGCDGQGDGGQLQNTPADGSCEAPGDFFMIDFMGGTVKNFTGTTEAVFACIAKLGTAGCGFEQPLASVQAALAPSHPGNTGFVRPDAFLAIVNVTDEDDCSASDDRLFDSNPSLDRLDSDLGFLSSYRCFDHGVTCDETDPNPVVDRTNLGPRTGCKADEESLLLRSVREHAEFLQGIKQGRPLVWSTSIAGPANEVANVIHSNGEPELEASCTGAKGTADPGFRLASASAEFGLPELSTSICAPSYETSLRGIADTLTALMSGNCLAAQPRDIDSAAAGLQTDCHIFDTADGGRGDVLATFAQCKEGLDKPCFTLENDAATCAAGAGLRVVVDRKGQPVPQGSAAVLRCTAE